MIRQLFAFEVLYQRKQWALLIGVVLFFGTGLQIGSQAFAPDLLNYNAPYQISYYVSLFTLGSVFAIMFFSISGVLREQQYRAESLIFSSGITKYHFYISRFLGVYIFSLIAFSPLIIGIIVGTHSFGLDPERLSPFSASTYLLNWLVFVVPNVFICTSILFSISLLTRNRLAVYAGAIFIYVAYLITSSAFGSPIFAGAEPANFENMALASISDPFGITAFMEQSQYWTPAQKNVLNVSLTGNFLANRILWIGLGFAILFITYIKFSFRVQKQKKNVSEKKSKTTSEISKSSYQVLVQNTDSFKFFWTSYIIQLKMGVKQLVRSLPFCAILLVWGVIAVSEIYIQVYQIGRYSEIMYPNTYLFMSVYQQPLFILGLMLIIFYSGEWVWKERAENFHFITDASPVFNSSIFLSKLTVLLLIPFLLILSGVLISIGFQVSANFHEFNIGLYLSGFYYLGFPLVFFILLALFIQTFLPNKYLGMLATGLLALLFSSNVSYSMDIEHPLLRMGAVPPVQYSDMTGLGNFAKPFHILSWHWFIFGSLLSLISFKLWNRGVEVGFIENLKKLRRSWSRPEKISLVVLLILFSASSVHIFYKTNIESEYLSSDQQMDVRADYEQKFKSFDKLNRLFPVSIKTDIGIYPNEQKYEVKATYLLINKHQAPIDTVLITPRGNLISLELNNSTLLEHNKTHNTYLFKLKDLLQLGDTVSLGFTVTKKQKGLRAERDIVNNGSFIMLRDFSPIMGYRSSLEIRNNLERQKRGLHVRQEEIVSEADFNITEISYGKVDIETILSTSSDQIGISVGNLIDQWTENDRNYFKFKTSTPVAPGISYYSGDYSVERSEFQDIKIEHYFHSSHSFNNETIMKSIRATLEYATREFGEYPFEHLRVVEIPALWGFGGYASPGTIAMVEDNLYLVDERDTAAFSLVAKRTIHEVAHQWWGHKLSPANTSGGGIFVEGFAKYMEAIVMGNLYGKRAIFQLSQSANKRYFTGRSYSQTPEQPLYLEQGEGYMLYGKSYTVMLALKDLIGEETVNEVLRTLIKNHKDELDATLTSIEFLNEIYKASPSESHSLIDDWFKRIIIYDLQVDDATYKKLENDTYEISITVPASRTEYINGIGSDIDLKESIPIGLFSAHPSEAYDHEIMYLKPHQLRTGENIIKIQVATLPAYISIDPYGTRLDMIRNDNWKKF